MNTNKTPEKYYMHRCCPVCSGEDAKLLFTTPPDPYFAKRFRMDDAKIVKCLSCGMKFTNPILNEEMNNLQYLDGGGYNKPVRKTATELIWDDQAIVYYELAACGMDLKRKRILDVGCGNGGFVYLCQKNGIDAHGTDIRENAVKQAAELGIKNISNKNFQQIESNSFDVISSIHVLEHLEDCREFLMEFSRILRPQGLVVVILPNYFSFTWRLKEKKYWNAPFQHMNGFTVQSLDQLFLQNNFRKMPLRGKHLNKEHLSVRSQASMLITKSLGNLLNLFPTKLLCLYQLR